MTIRKVLCLCLALMLCCAGAFAEADFQAQLDEANAKIAELQAQVDKYYPFYAAQIVATFGEDGIVWLDDVTAQYQNMVSQYSSMGLDVEGMGLADMVKSSVVDAAVQEGVVLAKAAELGLDQLDEEQTAALEAEAQSLVDGYVEYYVSYFYPDAEEITDEMRAEAEAYWATADIDYEGTLASLKNDLLYDAIYEYVTGDITITEEDVQSEYEGMLADNEAEYTADPSAFGSDYTGTVAWIPEGYRAVKQVLVGFSDEQSALYSQLQSQLTSLNNELAALETPAEPAEGEEAAAPRTAEEINADIAACAMEVEALYAELLPTAQQVISEFEAGASIDELIEKYNTDPGMFNEPTATMGYAVSEASTNWDAAFKDAAMSISEVGGLSEPAYGSYGIYVVYYMNDITPGAVDLETIRAEVEEYALDHKVSAAYDAQIAAWVEEANVEYFYSNFGIAAA